MVCHKQQKHFFLLRLYLGNLSPPIKARARAGSIRQLSRRITWATGGSPSAHRRLVYVLSSFMSSQPSVWLEPMEGQHAVSCLLLLAPRSRGLPPSLRQPIPGAHRISFARISRLSVDPLDSPRHILSGHLI